MSALLAEIAWVRTTQWRHGGQCDRPANVYAKGRPYRRAASEMCLPVSASRQARREGASVVRIVFQPTDPWQLHASHASLHTLNKVVQCGGISGHIHQCEAVVAWRYCWHWRTCQHTGISNQQHDNAAAQPMCTPCLGCAVAGRCAVRRRVQPKAPIELP